MISSRRVPLSLAPRTLLAPISFSSLSASVPVPWQRGTRRESNGFTDYVSVARNKRVAEERSARGDRARAGFYPLGSTGSVRARARARLKKGFKRGRSAAIPAVQLEKPVGASDSSLEQRLYRGFRSLRPSFLSSLFSRDARALRLLRPLFSPLLPHHRAASHYTSHTFALITGLHSFRPPCSSVQSRTVIMRRGRLVPRGTNSPFEAGQRQLLGPPGSRLSRLPSLVAKN